MKIKIILATALCLHVINCIGQTDPVILLTIQVSTCHGGKTAAISLVAKKSVLKKYLQKDVTHFNNCSYLLQSADDILKKGIPENAKAEGLNYGEKISVKDPGEFLELYKLEKESKASAEICINSNGEVSFSIGTEQGSIEISSSGKFALSAKSASGVTHKVEY